MKKIFLLFALMSALCVQSIGAQAIKGDMNDDAMLDVTDANELTNTMLGKQPIKYVSGAGDPYMVDNSRVVGTWYKTKSDHFTLNEDGTTDYVSDYGEVATYEFLPYQGIIIFYDKAGNPVSWIEVKKLIPGRMICNIYDDGDKPQVLTTEVPALPVTAIQLSATSLMMSAGEFKQVTATVLPADADNKSVVWESSNESVAKVMGDLVLAIANGTAVVTCRATDGSGVKAECTVTVKNKDNSGKDSAGHEYVDLGLPGGVLWATCNVGADKPEDYGLYFAWGETTGYAKGESHSFDWANYKWCNGWSSKMTKYSTSTSCWDSSLGTSPDGKTVLDPEDDAATVNWGSGWRMPTMQEQDDLRNSAYCTWTWKTNYNGSGVNGYEVKSKSNGNSIFLPAAGYRFDTSLYLEGSGGGCWSSSLGTGYSDYAYRLNLGSSPIEWDDFSRFTGRSVRAVRVASE